MNEVTEWNKERKAVLLEVRNVPHDIENFGGGVHHHISLMSAWFVICIGNFYMVHPRCLIFAIWVISLKLTYELLNFDIFAKIVNRFCDKVLILQLSISVKITIQVYSNK